MQHTLKYLSHHLQLTVSLNRFSLPAVFYTIKRCNLASSSVYSVSLISLTLAQLVVGVVGISKEGHSRTVLATCYKKLTSQTCFFVGNKLHCMWDVHLHHFFWFHTYFKFSINLHQLLPWILGFNYVLGSSIPFFLSYTNKKII